jgi:hypothetical protein
MQCLAIGASHADAPFWAKNYTSCHYCHQAPAQNATRGEAPSEAVIWQQEKTDRAVHAITFDSEIAKSSFEE